MASIKTCENSIAILSGKLIKLFDIRQGNITTLCLPEEPPKEERPQEDKKEPECGPNHTLTAAFSASGCHLAVLDDFKQLHLYVSDTSHTGWTLKTSRSVNRRSTSVVFTSDEGNVLVADKSGDVFKYSVTEPSSEGQLLMGHLSMLLDMKLSADDKYLITCDRDEKIRVSHFPNAYNIHSYCLGHTDFVTHLAYIPGAEAIISASGDGTIRCWNLKGEPLCCLSHGIQARTEAEEPLPPLQQQTKPSDCLAIVRCFAYNRHSGALAVTFDSSPVLQVYKVTTEEKAVCIKLHDDHNLPCVPWDVQFGPDSSLWILLPLQEKPVAIFTYLREDAGDADTFKIKELEVSSLSKEILQFQKTLSEDWDFFKESLDVPCWTKALAKSRVDNTLDYLKRKEQQMKKKQQLKPNESEEKLSEDPAKEPTPKVAKME